MNSARLVSPFSVTHRLTMPCSVKRATPGLSHVALTKPAGRYAHSVQTIHPEEISIPRQLKLCPKRQPKAAGIADGAPAGAFLFRADRRAPRPCR